jgi:hypothetical protein
VHLTVEVAVYATLTVLALVLRLMQLDWMPLDRAEAALALPAWQAASATANVRAVAPPLLYFLERLAFWFFAGSDVVARFVPALAGAALVPLAAGLRPYVGRPAALAAGVLLAVSPLWVFFGRSVSPATLIAAMLLLLIGALAGRRRRDWYVAAAAAGLLLAAGGPGLAALLAAVGMLGVMLLKGEPHAIREAIDERLSTKREQRSAVAVFVLALFLASTGLLLGMDGISALIEVPTLWFAPLLDSGAGVFGGFVLPLLVYAPVVTVFGLLGVVLALRSGRPFHAFLALWALLGLLLGILVGSPSALAQAMLPLTLTAGLALGAIAESVAGRFRWQEEGVMTFILLIILGYALIQAFGYAAGAEQALTTMTEGSGFLAAGALLMVVLLVIVFGILWGWSMARRVASLTALVALGALAVANGVYLNYRAADVLREAARPRYVAPGATGLADTISAASWANTRDHHEWPVVVDPVFEPTLAWSLKDRHVEWAPVSGAFPEPVAVVPRGTDLGADSGVEGAYRGQTHVVAGDWTPAFGSLQSFLAWYLQRAPGDARDAPALGQADLYISLD